MRVIYEYSPPASSAGRSSEKNDDASIMPDAPDIMRLNAEGPTFLKKKTSDAPAAVIAHVNVHASIACCQPGRLVKNCKIYLP